MHVYNYGLNPLILQPIFHQDLAPDPLNPVTQARQGQLWLFSTTRHSDWQRTIHRVPSSDVSINHFRDIMRVNPITCIKMHVDVIVLNRRSTPACCTLTLIPICSTEEVKGSTQGHYQTEWGKQWKWWCQTGNAASNMSWVFFFSIQTQFERYPIETTFPLKNGRFIRYFCDASFPLKCNGTRVIHVCPTFSPR